MVGWWAEKSMKSKCTFKGVQVKGKQFCSDLIHLKFWTKVVVCGAGKSAGHSFLIHNHLCWKYWTYSLVHVIINLFQSWMKMSQPSSLHIWLLDTIKYQLDLTNCGMRQTGENKVKTKMSSTNLVQVNSPLAIHPPPPPEICFRRFASRKFASIFSGLGTSSPPVTN